MAKRQVDLLQGTLDLLVLKSLALGPLHGLGVSNRIAQITNGTFNVKPGSLFPALHRMEEAGWLLSSWGRVREQSSCKVLSPDRSRPAPVRYRNAGLAAHFTGDHQRPEGDMRRRSRAVDSSSNQPLAQPVPQGQSGPGVQRRDPGIPGHVDGSESQARHDAARSEA